MSAFGAIVDWPKLSAGSYSHSQIDFPWFGEQGWRSGESTRVPSMWPGFDSGLGVICGLSLLFGSLLCSERFLSGYSGFPLSPKTNISKFQFDPDAGPPWKPLRGEWSFLGRYRGLFLFLLIHPRSRKWWEWTRSRSQNFKRYWTLLNWTSVQSFNFRILLNSLLLGPFAFLSGSLAVHQQPGGQHFLVEQNCWA